MLNFVGQEAVHSVNSRWLDLDGWVSLSHIGQCCEPCRKFCHWQNYTKCCFAPSWCCLLQPSLPSTMTVADGPSSHCRHTNVIAVNPKPYKTHMSRHKLWSKAQLLPEACEMPYSQVLGRGLLRGAVCLGSLVLAAWLIMGLSTGHEG